MLGLSNFFPTDTLIIPKIDGPTEGAHIGTAILGIASCIEISLHSCVVTLKCNQATPYSVHEVDEA